MKKITLDKIINFILFMYILSLYLFTYREGLFVISNGLALTFIFLVVVRILVNKSRININKYLLYHFLFICICTFSVFYAMSPSNAISDVKTLILIFIVMIAIVNFVDTPSKINWVIKSFIISGLISSIYIILVSDFTNITRYGSELGNTNAIGMIIGISSVFSINEYYRINKKIYLALLIPMLTVILLTGSRKSLLFIILTMLFIIYFKNKSNLIGKMKFIIIGTIILVGAFYIAVETPFFYEIIGKRMEGLFAMLTGKGKVDNSTATRKYMIEYGFNLFKDRPFLGYGSKNYQVMFGGAHGVERYAHNNFIELLVNVGLVGTLTYYLTNFKIVKDLYKHFKKTGNNDFIYPFMAICIAYFGLGTSLVYYYSKHFSYLLAVASVIPRMNCIDDRNKQCN